MAQYMSLEQYPQHSESFSEQPFAEFVTKTANGCNMQPLHQSERDPLALVQPGCDHCYMYTHSTAWQEEPAYMGSAVLEQTAFRIGEHAEAHRLAHVRVIAHGGEPLLALTKDPDYYSRYAETMHRHIDPTGAKVHLYMQTNGLLLNERRGPEIIKQLKEASFNIGLSIDGNQAANDLHRRDKAGRSTHSRAVTAARLLTENEADWGVLGVIDPRNNPEETVEYLASLKPRVINLFPMHAHNSEPPVEHAGAIPLGEWQKRALDYYIDWAKNHPGTDAPPFEMPIYDNYLRMAFGAPSLNDTAGARITQELFITPSGKWERLDTLKSADDGAVFTGLNIFEHSLDDVRRDPGIVARRMGLSALSPLCQGCEVLNLCFGGHYPNRYKRPEEPLTPQSSVEAFVEAFRNPSGHCQSHKVFLRHVNELVGNVAEVPAPTTAGERVLEDMDIITVPDDASELVKEKSLDKLLLPFRIAAYKQNYRHHEQANDATQSEIITPRLAHYTIKERPRVTRAQAAVLQHEIGRSLTGRIALEQIRLLSEQLDQGRALYYATEQDKQIPLELHAMLSMDYNDAIVNAVLGSAENRDSLKKAGGYWFVGRHIIEESLANPGESSGQVAVFRQELDWQPDSYFNGEDGIDYWQSLSLTQIPDSVRVSSFDLPGDLLVVDTASHHASDIAQAIQLIRDTFMQFKDAQALATALQENNIQIKPLLGHWPADTSWNSTSSGIAKRTLPELHTAKHDKATERIDYTGYPSINPCGRDYNKLSIRRSVLSV